MSERKINDIHEFEYRDHDVAVVMHSHLDAKQGIHVYVDGDDKTWEWFDSGTGFNSGKDGRVVTNGAIKSIITMHIDTMEDKSQSVHQEQMAQKFDVSSATPD